MDDAIQVGDVFSIDTGKGKAVLVIEEEWNALVDAFKLCIAEDEIIQKNGLGK